MTASFANESNEKKQQQTGIESVKKKHFPEEKKLSTFRKIDDKFIEGQKQTTNRRRDNDSKTEEKTHPND